MQEQRDCEVCARNGYTVRANREMNGTWLCVDCIVKKNQAEMLAANLPKKMVTLEPAAKPVVIPKQAIDPCSLMANLSFVLDELLAGNIEVDRAQAACKVSTELIKIMDLKLRFDRASKGE